MSNCIFKQWVCIILCLFNCCWVNADSIGVFVVSNSDANEIKNSLQGFLSQGSIVTVDQNRIIIKSDEKNLADLQQIIAALDVAKKRLKLEVYWGESTNREPSNQVQTLHVEDGEMVALTKTSIVKIIKTVAGVQQQLLMAEHSYADGAIKKDKQTNYEASEGAISQEFINLPEGIYLKPKMLNENQFKVDINIIKASDGIKKSAAEVRAMTQQVRTTMQVTINKWQNISGQDEVSNSEVTTYSTVAKANEQKIWLKISLVKS